MKPLSPKHSESQSAEEKPPFFRSWRHWYLLVLLNLAGLIVLFYLFTIYFE